MDRGDIVDAHGVSDGGAINCTFGICASTLLAEHSERVFLIRIMRIELALKKE